MPKLRKGPAIALILLVSACGSGHFVAGDGSSGGPAAGSGHVAGAGGGAGRAAGVGGASQSGAGGTSSGGMPSVTGGAGGASPAGGAAGHASGGTDIGGAAGADCGCSRNGYLPVCGADGTTYDAACGMQCVPVEIDCQGECPCATGGAGGGLGGSGGAAASGGSAGTPAAGAGGLSSCAVDRTACGCYADADCADGLHCYSADCANLAMGVCHAPPSSGCLGDIDCVPPETCIGGHPTLCGSASPELTGTCGIEACPEGDCGGGAGADCTCQSGDQCVEATGPQGSAMCRSDDGPACRPRKLAIDANGLGCSAAKAGAARRSRAVMAWVVRHSARGRLCSPA